MQFVGSQKSCHNNFLCLCFTQHVLVICKIISSILLWHFFFLFMFTHHHVLTICEIIKLNFSMLISNLCTWCVVWYLFSYIINFCFGKTKPFNFHMWWYEMWWYEKLLHMKSLPHPKPIQKDNLWNLELLFPPKLTPMYHHHWDYKMQC